MGVGDRHLPVHAPVPLAPLRVYFVIEVQAALAANMALRMMIYADLHGLQLGCDYERPLPPMVLSLEKRRWDASEDSAEILAVWVPASRPRSRDYVLDPRRMETEGRSGNLMAPLRRWRATLTSKAYSVGQSRCIVARSSWDISPWRACPSSWSTDCATIGGL